MLLAKLRSWTLPTELPSLQVNPTKGYNCGAGAWTKEAALALIARIPATPRRIVSGEAVYESWYSILSVKI